MTGTIGDVTRHVTVKIRVDGDVPTMPSPRLTPLKGSRFDTTSYLARVGWGVATDGTSPILKYQAQVKVGTGDLGHAVHHWSCHALRGAAGPRGAGLRDPGPGR